MKPGSIASITKTSEMDFLESTYIFIHKKEKQTEKCVLCKL